MIYFGLRLYNTALGMAWGFGLTWVLVRALGVVDFAPYVFTAAIGLYLAAANLGSSQLLYALLRDEYVSLAADGKPISSVARMAAPSAIVLFFAITGFAIAGYTVLIGLKSDNPSELTLFFASMALFLPWNNIRAVLEAAEQQVFYESLDAIRRTLQFISLFTILLGAPLTMVFGFHLALWIFVFVSSLKRAKQVLGIRRWWWGLRGQRAFLTYLRGKLGPTIAFTLSEMWIYNGAYIMIPLLFISPAALVIYDVFNKIIRAAINVNIVLSTTALPHLTRNWHENNHSEFLTSFRRLIFLSILAMTTFNGVLWQYANDIVNYLLNGQADIPATMVGSIIIIAFANALQNSIGSVIIGLGYARAAHWLALIMASLIAALYGITLFIGLSFSVWLLAYALVYLAGALLWLGVGRRIMRKKSFYLTKWRYDLKS